MSLLACCMWLQKPFESDKLSADVRTVGSVDRESGDSYKAAELLYQTRVGSAFTFSRQPCLFTLQTRQGGLATGAALGLKRCTAFFPSHGSWEYTQFQIGVGHRGEAPRL